MAPGTPDDPNAARMTVGPKAVKDMVDHFPSTKSSKNDPQLIWCFDDTEVHVRSPESSLESLARGISSTFSPCPCCSRLLDVYAGGVQIVTELTMDADQFDLYDIPLAPVALAFHLREFNVRGKFHSQDPGANFCLRFIIQATIAYAESMALALDLKFTEPAAPLFIEVQSDNIESLFVISTSQALGASKGTRATSQARSTTESTASQPRQRAREGDSEGRGSLAPERRRPMKVAQRTDAAGLAKTTGEAQRSQSRALGSMPPPSVPHHSTSMPPPPSIPAYSQQYQSRVGTQAAESSRQAEPLFLPSSQMSVADEEALRASGLGIDNMDADDFRAMMEDEGEEVGFEDEYGNNQIIPGPEIPYRDGKVEMDGQHHDRDSLNLLDDIEMGPTQSLEGNKVCG
ncbi:hypothetical protein EW146_g5185 [Bondarzewia mesenterica]|uniref:Cell cycle checkpoint control protein RAD9A n=1 Tax=Bondarzewia mesenterica TaxID=1095465 RepID=A0A4V3XEW9_9AGAM|nr:hypothetical protein EW146_g5185 [Bondarzewia mesenterica]